MEFNTQQVLYMKNEKCKIAVFGALNVDICGAARTRFVSGDSNPGEVSDSLGGVGWNMARSAAALGARTMFFAMLGRDEYAARIEAEAAAFGVDIGACRWADQPNSRYVYITDDQGDMVAAVNDMRLCERFGVAEAEQMMPFTGDCKAALLDANLLPETLELLAERLTMPIVADSVSAAKCRKLLPVLGRIHTLKANRLEAQELTGRRDAADCALALLELGVKQSVVSMGTEGIVCAQNGRVFRLAAVPTRAVSTNGAGDALTAALAVGLARDADFRHAADLGCRAAAITASEPGGATLRLRGLARD
jgi:Sugar kinases, ribokinase family